MKYFFFTCLLLLCSAADSAKIDADTRHALGESLTYKAHALGFIPIGTVWFNSSTGSYKGIPTFHFTGKCLGDYMVYVADVRVSSHLSQENDHSLFHEIQQYGSERRARQLTFNRARNTLKYTRLERDGTYKERRTVPMGADVWDIFGAAFHYRKEFPTNVGEHCDIKIVEITRMYHLRCKVVEKRLFDLKGIGVCEAIRIEMKPLNLKPEEVFDGLLELDKDVELWLEAKTRTPIYLKTGVPFGIVRPTITVRLTEWNAVEGYIPSFTGPGIGVRTNARIRVTH
jgi:hypothetical protein